VSLRLDWKPRARRDLDRLDPPTRARIVAAVLKLAETHQGDVIKLSGKSPPEYRLRVGGLRVRFAWDQVSGVLIVLHVFKRGQGYD
jgi:mRNA-degrading endonuclease RelE of RelBE toxin-antitoxin system